MRRHPMSARHGLVLLALAVVAGGCGSLSGDDTGEGGQDVTAGSNTTSLAVVKTWVGHFPFDKLVGAKELWDQPPVLQAMRTAMGPLFAVATGIEGGPSDAIVQDPADPNHIVR
jgi:hypothetical protein